MTDKTMKYRLSKNLGKGRPLSYNEVTKIISFRVPISKIPVIREIVNGLLGIISKEAEESKDKP